MSPEDRAATSALVRLRREIADDRTAMAKHVAEMAEARARWKKEPDDHAVTVLGARCSSISNVC